MSSTTVTRRHLSYYPRPRTTTAAVGMVVALICAIALIRRHLRTASDSDRRKSRLRLTLLGTALMSRLAELPASAHSALVDVVAYFQSSVNEDGALSPLNSLLSTTKIESFLLAWIPVSYFGKRYSTGNYAVDMFVTSALATLIISAGTIAVDAVKALAASRSSRADRDSVSVRVEFLRRGPWYYGIQNEHHTALAWLISQRSEKQSKGRFRMVPFENEYADNGSDGRDDDDSAAVTDSDKPRLDFNLVPSSNETEISITDEGHKFNVWFDYAAIQPQSSDKRSENAPPEPPIVVQRVGSGPTTIEWMKDWLSRVSVRYVADQKRRHVRGRHEFDVESGGWKFIHPLPCSLRGLKAVALDVVQEGLLIADLDSFVADQDFYKRMGLPYRRGLMFSGKPGTGKTSLINAISAAHNRDVYMINLKSFKDDKSLQNAFSRVPANGMIVFEDVDAQSRCVWDRERRKKMDMQALMGPLILSDEERERAMRLAGFDAAPPVAQSPVASSSASSVASAGDDSASDTTANASSPDTSSTTVQPSTTTTSSSSSSSSVSPPSSLDDGPTLATLLNCLDGHSSSPGILIVFTTNHPEVLDPALTRPGRIDLHLSLGHCSHHQLTRMYANVTESTAADTDGNAVVDVDWSGVEEGVVPPCEAMRIMILNRRTPHLIPGLVRDRCTEILEGRVGVAGGGTVQPVSDGK